MEVIAQLTDLHIDDNAPHLQHLNSRENTLRVLDDVRARGIDKIFLTGDIAEPSGRQWFFSLLGESGIRYEAVRGNHDPETAAEFPERYFKRTLENETLLFLDSGSSRIDQTQLGWFSRQLEEASERVILFLHHPVLDCGNTAMDRKYPLGNRDELRDMMTAGGKRITIFCGHYHAEHFQEYKNITQYVTPSCYYQIRMDTKKIEPDHRPAGYRIIEFGDGRIRTEAVYVGGKL